MLESNDTKGRFRLSLDFSPLRRLFRTGVKPRTLLIAALALFLIVATVYAAITYPTLFSPTGPQPTTPGQMGPDSTDRTCVPTAGANSPAVPSSDGGSQADAGTGSPGLLTGTTVPTASAGTLEPAATDTPATTDTAAPAVEPSGETSDDATPAPAALAWPLHGKTITGFGIVQSVTLGDWRQHDGIDIQCVQGMSVVAAADGTVTASEKRNDTGLTVVIDHGGGVTTVYGCLLVTGRKAGDRVKAGDEIGKAGNSGMSEVALDNHLHFEVREDSLAVDPANWLK